MSSHPKDLSDRLLDVMAQERVLCRHIHLPVQHGSSKILSAMNRKYTREQYLSLVDRIRRKLPDVSLSTDILIGFPGETEGDFAQTVSLMQTVGYEAAYMYYYNPREGTPSAKMDLQIEEEEKIRRLERLIQEQLDRAHRIKESRLPFETKVLIRGNTRDDKDRLLGYNEHNDMVSFMPKKAHVKGDMVRVRLTELNGNTYRGEEIDV